MIRTIPEIIENIDPSALNTRGPIFINETKNELFDLPAPAEVPRISVKEIDRLSSAAVVSDIISVVPSYFRGHTLLPQPRPQSEVHHLHFVMPVKGRAMQFIHMFKLDFRFSSDMGRNYRDGTADFYPSYTTDRVRYKSCLIPVESVEMENGAVVDFIPKKIFEDEKIEGDRFLFAHTLVDDFDPSEIHDRIYAAVDADIFPFSRKIYSFLEYGYFSLTMKIPDPLPELISQGAEIFEPLFFKVQSAFSGDNAAVAAGSGGDLVLCDGLPVLSDEYKKKAQKYFSHYSLFQNDELALKRWRRLDVAP
ncbi:MAG: hypothetical protein ACRCUT_12200 [Spirochaetota bacterium]